MLVRIPDYPCDHPRTVKNSRRISEISGMPVGCRICFYENEFMKQRIRAFERCRKRGHTRKQVRNKDGRIVCSICTDEARRRGGKTTAAMGIWRTQPRDETNHQRFVRAG